MDSLLFNNHHPSPKPQPPPPPSQLLLDRRAAAAAAPAEKAPLPCPRCESTNTKFCYYNNYNLSQPRHFCKACRRYWTRGGTLRNVPVGGGTRKSTTSNSSNNNNKRPRVTTPAPAPTNHHNDSDSNNDHVPHGTQTESTVTALDPDQAEVADVAKQPGSLSSSCWWSGGQMGAGFLPTLMNGYGLGLGYYEQAGVLDWPNMDQVRGDDGTTTVMQQHHHGEEEEEESSHGCDTWQVGGGDHGVAGGDGGDFLSWPELAISTSTPAAKALK